MGSLEYLEEPLLEAARADQDHHEDLPRLSAESPHVCEQVCEQRVVVEVVGIPPDEGGHQSSIIRGHQRQSGLVFEVVGIPP